MNPVNLYEAYVSVYDEDLDTELSYVEEDLSFIDELTDDELCLVMENLIINDRVDVNECFESLDYFLSEATVTYGHEDQARRDRTADRQRRVRVGRMQQAAGRAAEKVASGVSKGAKFLGGKLASAGRKIGRFLGRVGSAAKAGYSAAKQEFKYPKKYAKSRPGSGDPRVTADYIRSQRERHHSGVERSGSPTDPSKGRNGGEDSRSSQTTSGGSNRNSGVGRRERASSGDYNPNASHSQTTYDLSSERRKKAAEKLKRQASGRRGGTRFAGPAGQVSGQAMHSGQDSREERRKKAEKFANKAGIGEEFVYILEQIMEDLIFEDYAIDFNDAVEILESLTYGEFGELVDQYLSEEVVVRDDVFDDIFEYLLDEGFADTEEDAMTIMANMSEDWREQIIEARSDEGLSREDKERVRAERQGRDRISRWMRHDVMRGRKREKGVKSSYDTQGNMIRTRYRQQQFKRTGNPVYAD